MKENTTPGTGLWARIARARKNMAAIPKNGVNPHFGNRFATADDIDSVILPALEEEGLFLTGSTVELGGGLAYAVTIRPTDARDGEAAICLVPLVGLTDMQKCGGGLSYASRYGKKLLLSLETGDHDDDGNLASGVGGQGRPSAPPPSRQAAPSGSGQAPRAQGQANDACPTCGNVGAIRRISKGKDAGLWVCMKWPDKGFNGCGGKFTSNPSNWTKQEQEAHGLPVEKEQPVVNRGWTEPQPVPSEDDLPF